MDANKAQLQAVVKKIIELRVKKKFSQLELAGKAGLSQGFLALIETGKKQPSVLSLIKIANALEVNPKVLFPADRKASKEQIKEEIISLLNSL